LLKEDVEERDVEDFQHVEPANRGTSSTCKHVELEHTQTVASGAAGVAERRC